MKQSSILTFILFFGMLLGYIQFAEADYWMIPYSQGYTSIRDVTDGSHIIRVERIKDWATGNVWINAYDITKGTTNPPKLDQFEISDDDLYQYNKMSQGRGLDLALEMTAYCVLIGLGAPLTAGYIAVGGKAGLAAEDALTRTLLKKGPSSTKNGLKGFYRKISTEYAKKTWLTGDLNCDGAVKNDEVEEYIKRMKYGLVSPDTVIEAIYNLDESFLSRDLISQVKSGLNPSEVSQMASNWLNKANSFFNSGKYGEATRACSIVTYLDSSLGESCAYMQKTTITPATSPKATTTATTNSPTTGTTATTTTTITTQVPTTVGKTKENPVPMGTSVDLGTGWIITVLDAIPDATSIIRNACIPNRTPSPGHQFVIAKIRAEYKGHANTWGCGTLGYGGDYNLKVESHSGNVYSTALHFPCLPGSVAPILVSGCGGVCKGNICWDVLASDADKLVMYDTRQEPSERTYMALYKNIYLNASLN